MTSSSSESLILDAWQASADAWERAVREGRIESRKLVTDRAIVAAVLSHAPRRVIDVGCGEGFSQPAPWYFRTLGRWLDAFHAAYPTGRTPASSHGTARVRYLRDGGKLGGRG